MLGVSEAVKTIQGNMARDKKKSGGLTLPGIAAALLLIATAGWLAASVVSYVNTDYRPGAGEGFIYPPPRPIENWGGAAGAMASEFLHRLFGYSAVVLPLILFLLGISRGIRAPGRRVLLLSGDRKSVV